MFYGRENERKKLCTMFHSDGQMISLIYGRRRIGKSELIKQVLKETDIKSVYYECKQTTEQNNVDSLAELIGEAFDFPKPAFENMEDLLAIESKLSDVRYELENYGSQLRLLDNQIDYSTVNVDVDEVERVTDTGEKSFFGEIKDRFGNSLYTVGRDIRGFVIVVLGSLPILIVWAVIIVIAVLIVKKIRKGRKKKKEEKKVEKTE